MTDLPQAGEIQMKVQWNQDPLAVPAPTNQFLIQAGPAVANGNLPDTFILTFGHLTPPAIPQFESADEAERFAATNVALVAPVARLSFTTNRLRELHDILGQVIGQLDQS